MKTKIKDRANKKNEALKGKRVVKMMKTKNLKRADVSIIPRGRSEPE